MALKSITLIVVSVAFLVVPGMLYNNLNNNGLVVSQAQTLTCSTDPETPTCQISATVGCQSNTNYCNLSGSSISFLSGNSPFTQLLSGNIFALFAPVQSPSSAPQYGPFDLVGGGAYVFANCIIETSLSTGQVIDYWIYFCTQSNPDGSNMTLTNSNTWGDWNYNLLGQSQKSIHYYHILSNSTGTNQYQIETSTGRQFNFSTSNSYSWIALNYYAKGSGATNCNTIGSSKPACPPLYPSYSLLIRVTNTDFANALPLKYHCDAANPTYWCLKVANTATMLTASWTPLGCLEFDGGDFWSQVPWGQSPQCKQWQDSITTQAQSVSSTAGYGIIAPILTFLLGLVLLFIGTGINIGASGTILASGVSGNIGTNEQGTRLAQVLGLGLVVWSFLYSEFAFWFTSGFLPYGLDGAFGLVGAVLTGMFFIGLFWRFMSID